MTESVLRPRLLGRARTALVAGLATLALLVPALPAAAVDNGEVGIRPSNESDFFHLSLSPGAATDAVAIVTNHTGEDKTLRIYPVDGQSSPQGTFAFADETDRREGVGSWVQLDMDEIVVPANSDLAVPFRLSVPEGAVPGDYAGGLIIESPPVEGETSVLEGGTAVRLDIIQRQGLRIYLDVAGTAVTTLEHGELTWEQADGAVTFSIPVTNTGNTILQPQATLDISSTIGVNTKLAFDAPESVLPGGTYVMQAIITDPPLIQLGTAVATIDSEAGTERVEVNFSYAPWLLIAIVAVALLVLGYVTWRIARFVRRAREAIAEVSRPQARRTGEITLPDAAAAAPAGVSQAHADAGAQPPMSRRSQRELRGR